MKQFFFIVLLTLVGTVGTLAYDPFLGVVIYYLFAVLRPQALWEWALQPYRLHEVSFSFYVAIATILAAIGQNLKLLAPPSGEDSRPLAFAFTGAHLALLSFALAVCISYVTAFDQQVAEQPLIEYLKIFVMFFVSSVLIYKLQHLWVLLITAALSLGYLAYEVNFLYLQYRRITILHAGYGGLDSNGAGLMLAMGVPLCLAVWEGSRRWWRWVFAAFIPVLVHAVLMSYSRGAMVALLLASPLFYVRSREKGYMSLAYAGVAMLMPLMAGPEIQQRFFSIEQYEKDKSANSRFQSWSAALEIAKDHPLFGVGLRNANLHSYAFGADMPNRTIHSQYFQLAADCGFVGLGAYLLTLFCVWRNLTRVRRQMAYRDDPEARQAVAIINGVEGGLAVFAIGAVFLSLEHFELPYLLLLLGAQLPLVVEGPVQREREQAITGAAPAH